MLSAFIVASIFLSVFLSYRTKINTGFFCMVFAYLIGCFALGLRPGDLIAMWPVGTMFVILAVSLFYNFAALNGTLEKLSGALLYACRRFPRQLPYALFFVAAVLSIMGATYFTVLAFLSPITLAVCDKVKMDKLTGVVAINCGALSGGDFPTAALGVIFRGIMGMAYTSAPADAIDTFSCEMKIFGLTIVLSIIVITLFNLCVSRSKEIGRGVEFKKPESCTPKQKTTLRLIIIMMFIVLFFQLLRVIAPGAESIVKIADRIDVGLVAVVFTVIGLLLGLAPQKDVIAGVPWNTIIMIAGAGMLISVAVRAGTVAAISEWIASSIPAVLVPTVFSIVGGTMGAFSSSTGVIAPALFPLIPSLAAEAGLNAETLFICTVTSAQSGAISPLSTGGSLILSGCRGDEERDKLFYRLIFIAAPINILCCIIYNFAAAMIIG